MASSNEKNVEKELGPMNIAGRTESERERLIGMTDEERAWRKRWVQSQILAPDEPRVPEGYYKARYNPLRRFYRAPMDKLENALIPMTNPTTAFVIRHVIAKLSFTVLAVYCGWYYCKHNKMNWERRSGWRIMAGRPAIVPGDKDFPNYKRLEKPNEFYVLGFDKSPI